jgi:hypothetical protein
MSSTLQLRTYLLVVLFLPAVAFSQQTEQKFASRTDAGFQYTTLQVPGSSSTMAYGVNNNGDVVGTFISGGVESGFLYTGGVFQTIFCPGASYTVAQGINDEGVIVGYCDPKMYAGFVYQNGTYTYITHPKSAATFLMGINNQGLMVGIWQKGDGRFQRSFVYSDGAFATINGLEAPGGINNSNTISGYICNSKMCKGAIYFQGENG